MFHQNFPGIVRSGFNGFHQFFTVFGDLDADTGTEIRRFDDDGIREFAFDVIDDIVFAVAPLDAVEPETIENGYAPHFAEGFLRHFIHTRCRGQHRRTGIRNAGQFQKALEGAVFTVGAVHHRKKDINDGERLFVQERTGINKDRAVFGIGRNEDLFAIGQKFLHILEVFDIEKGVSPVPIAFFADVNGENIVFFFIQRLNGL